jgi:hypothetical protein
VPVPDHVDLSSPVWGQSGVHFYVPQASWALAVAQASYQLEHLATESLDLRLSPSFWLAVALKESFLGCDDSTMPDSLHPLYVWVRQPSTDANGCFQIAESTAWLEMCKLYPAQFDCSVVSHADVISASNQSVLGRSNFESGAIVVAYYAVFAYAMLAYHGVDDPDSWFAAAADPLAPEKVMALIYNRGAWSSQIATVLQDCQHQDIESCLVPSSVEYDYVENVGSLTAELLDAVAAESCYNPNVNASEITTYLDRLAPLFPRENWSLLHAQAQEAFRQASGGQQQAPFQQIARPVLDVLHTGMQARLACPNDQLQSEYQQTCPP